VAVAGSRAGLWFWHGVDFLLARCLIEHTPFEARCSGLRGIPPMRNRIGQRFDTGSTAIRARFPSEAKTARAPARGQLAPRSRPACRQP
jgi:hypothetical protein